MHSLGQNCKKRPCTEKGIELAEKNSAEEIEHSAANDLRVLQNDDLVEESDEQVEDVEQVEEAEEDEEQVEEDNEQVEDVEQVEEAEEDEEQVEEDNEQLQEAEQNDEHIEEVPSDEWSDVETDSEFEQDDGRGNEDEFQTTEEEVSEELLQSEFEVCELQIENEELRAKNVELEEELKMWKAKFEMCSQSLQMYQAAYATSFRHMRRLDMSPNVVHFSASFIFNDDEKTKFYTGLPSYAAFTTLFDLLKTSATKEVTPRCSLIDELFLTLTKITLALLHKDIAYRTNLSESLVSKIFHKWLDLMYRELRQLITWPDRETLRKNLPACFRKHYGDVVSIIDCFEIFIERPSAHDAKAATYSQYKKHNTVKFLIGISPTCAVSFLSKGWGGRVSDKVITQKSGYLDNICSYDRVLADRGFNIGDDLAVRCATLEIPAFTRGKNQLAIAEVEKTRQIAQVRIHVERVIGLLRKKYKILQSTIPISLLKRPSDKDITTIDKIVTVAASLINLSNPVLS